MKDKIGKKHKKRLMTCSDIKVLLDILFENLNSFFCFVVCLINKDIFFDYFLFCFNSIDFRIKDNIILRIIFFF
jgi:hypothetical protein